MNGEKKGDKRVKTEEEIKEKLKKLKEVPIYLEPTADSQFAFGYAKGLKDALRWVLECQ